MNKEEFMDAFGGAYEHSPWAAQRAWTAALNGQTAIISAMRAVVVAADCDEQDMLIKAHPDLAGKLALSGALTQSSTKEQAGAGLDQCTPDELAKFQKYNAAYKDKFSFPFIIAVSGLGRTDILAAFEKRLNNNRTEERKTALEQIHKIATIRIRAWFDEYAHLKEQTMTDNAPDFTKLTNLAAIRLGSKVVYATDDFFADKARLIDPSDPVFITDKYDDNGKWMDGWESRRKRVEGHDWAIVKLGKSGIIKGIEIDTAHFTGNFPPFASLEVANSNKDIPDDKDWHEIIPKTDLQGDSQHFFGLDDESENIWTHIRLHIYPDGGVARLRVYGHVFMDWDKFDRRKTIDLAALEYGGRGIYANDMHYGVPENLIAPGKGVNMGDGWETRRRREPGNDWCVLALAHAGEVERIVLDTKFFKGNYPNTAFIQAANLLSLSDDEIIAKSESWQMLLPSQKLSADTEHKYKKELKHMGAITHIRLNIVPDGGVSRLRIFGKVVD